MENKKAKNSSLTDEATKTLDEDKIMGITLIEAAQDKRYGEFNRSLQYSMPEGHNRYSDDRVMAHMTLSKYKTPEVRSRPPTSRSDENRDTDSTSTLDGVSFYQRVHPCRLQKSS